MMNQDYETVNNNTKEQRNCDYGISFLSVHNLCITGIVLYSPFLAYGKRIVLSDMR